MPCHAMPCPLLCTEKRRDDMASMMTTEGALGPGNSRIRERPSARMRQRTGHQQHIIELKSLAMTLNSTKTNEKRLVWLDSGNGIKARNSISDLMTSHSLANGPSGRYLGTSSDKRCSRVKGSAMQRTRQIKTEYSTLKMTANWCHNCITLQSSPNFAR